MTPRSLGGGSARVVLADPVPEMRVTLDDVRAVVDCYARECATARVERQRIEHRLADRRMAGADRMVAAWQRAVREQHGAETMRSWWAQAEREAGVP